MWVLTSLMGAVLAASVANKVLSSRPDRIGDNRLGAAANDAGPGHGACGKHSVAPWGKSRNHRTNLDKGSLQDVLAGHAPVQILDYDPDQDWITLYFDPARIDRPDVSVTTALEGPGTASIWLNGYLVAQVAHRPHLRAEDIRVIAGHPASAWLLAG